MSAMSELSWRRLVSNCGAGVACAVMVTPSSTHPHPHPHYHHPHRHLTHPHPHPSHHPHPHPHSHPHPPLTLTPPPHPPSRKPDLVPSKVAVLSSLGVPSSRMGRVLVKCPQLLNLSTDTVTQAAEWMRVQAGMTPSQVQRVVTAMPRALTYSIPDNLEAKRMLLTQLGEGDGWLYGCLGFFLLLEWFGCGCLRQGCVEGWLVANGSWVMGTAAPTLAAVPTPTLIPLPPFPPRLVQRRRDPHPRPLPPNHGAVSIEHRGASAAPAAMGAEARRGCHHA